MRDSILVGSGFLAGAVVGTIGTISLVNRHFKKKVPLFAKILADVTVKARDDGLSNDEMYKLLREEMKFMNQMFPEETLPEEA